MLNNELVLKSIDYTIGEMYNINNSNMMYFGIYNNLYLLFGDVILHYSPPIIIPFKKFQYFNYFIRFRKKRQSKIPTENELKFINNQINKYDIVLNFELNLIFPKLLDVDFFHIDNIYYFPKFNKTRNVLLLAVYRMG